MTWRYDFTNRTDRDLADLDEDDRRRVFGVLDRLADDPTQSDLDIRKLKGKVDEWAIRVGRWRVRFVYDRGTRTILITHVLPRNESTYRD